MRFSRVCLTFVLLLQVFTSHAQISKGQQILLDRGLQIQGLVSHTDAFHLSTYTNANYNSISLFWDPAPSYLGTAPGYPWARWARSEAEMPPLSGEAPYLSQLITLQLGDEWELNDDLRRTELVNWFNAVRTNWPNTILFHNNYGGQVGDAQLYDFYSRAQPDMLAFDAYPFRLDGSGNKYQTLVNWYSDFRRYRQHAMGANLPLATYLQTFGSTSENVSHPSGSELHLQHSAALAFNCKVMIDFTYNTGASSLFDKTFGGDNAPTALYYEKADAALRARNLGKALIRLKPVGDVYFPDLRTTSMMFIRGRNDIGAINPFPIGFYAGTGGADVNTDWAYQRNDPYLASWAVTNKGTKNNGQPGDVIISWFKPLDESFDGTNYSNEVYMMVVNGLSDLTGTGAECVQEIKLNFASGLTALEMLNPLTGLVEVTPLPLVNGLRQLVLNLNGGDAALFKFSDGAPFIGADLTGAPVITAEPANQVAAIGTTATFTARAAGAAPLKYQWKFKGIDIPGATTTVYQKTNVQFSDVGGYSLVVSNNFGTMTSSAATLSVRFTVPPEPPFLYEPFAYTNIGAPVSSNTPANWTNNVAAATNDTHVASGSLYYPGLTLPVGNSVTNGGVGLGIRRLLGTNVTSGTFYFSALFRMNSLGYGSWNGAASQVGAFTSTDNTSFRLQVMVKSNSPSGYVFGVQKGGTGASTVFDTTEYHTNETVLLVGKYDFTTAPNPASLWINPNASTFGASSTPTNGFISSAGGTDGLTIDRFNMRQNTAVSVPAAMQWDELRFGTNWASVTPPASPLQVNAVTLLSDGRLQLLGSGDEGTFVLEASTNLVQWAPATNVVISNGIFEFTESSTGLPQRFYRLKFFP